MSTTKRDKILERIINLRNRAEDDGSSENEAMTSLTMAAKLMDAYQVQEAELALAESEGRVQIEVITKTADASAMNGGNRHRIILVFGAIQQFTNTKIVSWQNRYSSRSGRIEVTGDKSDVEVANYLIQMIRTSLDREYENYKKSVVGVGRGAKASFQTAMASRVGSRLSQMAREAYAARKDAAKGNVLAIGDERIDTSTALVMLDIAAQKREQVNEAFASKYSRLGSSRGFGRTSNGTAHGAGSRAGDRLNLGKALNQSQTRELA